MNAKIRQNINDILDTLDAQQYNRISQKIKFEDGRELVINMIYNTMEQFPDFTFGNALADVEVTLKNINNG